MEKTFEFTLDGTSEKKSASFKAPTYKETTALDFEYRRAFSEAVRNGIMTTAEATKSFKKENAWTDEDDADISRTIIEISDAEIKLGKREGESEELYAMATELSKKRNDLMEKMNRRSQLFENTAEGIADQCRVYKMVYYCLLDEDGERFFDSEEEFESFSEQYPTAISYIYRKAYFFQYDVDENINDRWEEVKYLKERADELKQSIDDVKGEQDAVETAIASAESED